MHNFDIKTLQSSSDALFSARREGGTESLSKYRFSHSSAEEHLENKQKKPHVLKCRHVFALISLQKKWLTWFYSGGRVGWKQDQLLQGAPVLRQNFLHPNTIQSWTQLREEGLYGCMTLLTSLRDARDYSSISHLLYACIKHRDWGRCLLPSPPSL